MVFFFCLSLLDPRPWPEESYELGPVHPAIRPSVLQFSWHWFTSFISKLWMLLRSHLEMCVRELDFIWKNHNQVKTTKNGQNGTETGFLDYL